MVLLYQATYLPPGAPPSQAVLSPPVGGLLWGGHDFSFGPHAWLDPGMWVQPPYQVKDTTFIYWAAPNVNVGQTQTQLPNITVGGTDAATVIEADRQAQWAAYNYLLAH